MNIGSLPRSLPQEHHGMTILGVVSMFIFDEKRKINSGGMLREQSGLGTSYVFIHLSTGLSMFPKFPILENEIRKITRLW